MHNVAKTRCISVSLVTAVALILACKGGTTESSGSSGGNNGQGGATSSGGTTSSGGATSSGGSKATGGTTSSGGSKATGGTTSSGGTSNTASSGGSTNSGGSIGSGGGTSTPSSGGTTSAGGTTSTGGDTGAGGATSAGGATGAGGSTSTATVVCKPASATVNDFSASDCSYGAWGDGEMNTSGWTYGNGTSSLSATCGSGSWTFSGTVGVSDAAGANAAGFGFSLMGYVHDNTAAADVNCNVFDLSKYAGFSIKMASASGAIGQVGIGVDLADGSKGKVEVSVPTTATAVPVTWSQLGISDASRITGIWGYFLNGASSVSVDLVITGWSLQ
jgi:hypothetical protein